MGTQKVAKVGKEIKFPTIKSKEEIEYSVWLSSLKAKDAVAMEVTIKSEIGIPSNKPTPSTYEQPDRFYLEDTVEKVEDKHIHLATSKKIFDLQNGLLIGDHNRNIKIVALSPFVKGRIIQQLYVLEIQRLCEEIFKRASIKQTDQNLRLCLAVLNQLKEALDMPPEEQSKLFEDITERIKKEPAKEGKLEESSLEKQV